jgi:hypothetical protein
MLAHALWLRHHPPDRPFAEPGPMAAAPRALVGQTDGGAANLAPPRMEGKGQVATTWHDMRVPSRPVCGVCLPDHPSAHGACSLRHVHALMHKHTTPYGVRPCVEASPQRLTRACVCVCVRVCACVCECVHPRARMGCCRCSLAHAVCACAMAPPARLTQRRRASVYVACGRRQTKDGSWLA